MIATMGEVEEELARSAVAGDRVHVAPKFRR
jgi:hypothetical protein